jgi:hypothetical protein
VIQTGSVVEPNVVRNPGSAEFTTACGARERSYSIRPKSFKPAKFGLTGLDREVTEPELIKASKLTR